ncbi:MAG: hypothetical protein IJP95_08290 [Bacteroidales bacterium]|nr:hypothetical protein [Bacteroidales bacterium]
MEQPKKNANPISTGLDNLDSLLWGWLQQGHIHILASRPPMGKTSFSVTLAINVAINNDIPTAHLSY